MISWVLMLALNVGAQEAPEKKKRMSKEERMEKYEAQKVAYLTAELDLSTEQAQKFWPVYNEYSKKKRALREEMNWKKVDDMTEAEAEEFLEKSRGVKAEADALDQQMMADMEGIVSAKQRLKLMRAEKNFHREVAKRFSKRKKKMKRKGAKRERVEEAPQED